MDPFCGWCYASAPALKAVAERFPAALTMRPSGLFAGARPIASIADHSWRNAKRIAELTGQQTSLEDITSAVGQINVPTLVISGDKDKVDPVETLKRELLPRISGAVLQVLPDVGHLSPLEAPKEIAHHLDSFAKELQSKP